MLEVDAPATSAVAVDGRSDDDSVLSKGRFSVYQPEQEGLIFPEIPTFKSVGEERLYRKTHLVAACRIFAKYGYDYGFAGHLTVRDPEHPNLYWTNPMCVHFADVRMSNIVLADHSGQVVEGKYAINRAGFVLHASVHRLRPEVMAMCHAHTSYGSAFCATGRPLDPISLDACSFFEDQAVVGKNPGIVTVEGESGIDIAEAMGGARAILHQNHGLLTTSKHSIDAAAWWFIALETCCRAQLAVEASGMKIQLVPPELARYNRKHAGTSFIAWLHFQTLYNHIAKRQPDMFD